MRSVLVERMISYAKETINEDKYEIVGSELRNRRIKYNLTLDALADGICSLSYLCKIETNKIEPNAFYLKEICKRLSLTDTQVDVLLDLRNIIEKCIEAFINKKYELIDEYYLKCSCFDNYRANLVNLIYHLVNHNIVEANKIYLDLIQIAETMREFDFIVLSLFSSILHYYNYKFHEALEILNSLSKYKLSKNLSFLRKYYLFKASYGANMSDTILYYNDLVSHIVKEGKLQYIDELKYNICLYYLKNNCDYSFNNEIINVSDETYFNSLKIIYDFKNKNISNIINFNSDKITLFAKLIRLYIVDLDKFKLELESHALDYYRYDFDYNLLDFFNSANDPNFTKYLFNVLIPRVGISDDDFIKRFILSEVIKMPQVQGKNKVILKTVLMLFRFNDADSYFSELNSEEE